MDMDNNLVENSLQGGKITNKAKTKKRPMKVVYISNPIKFKIGASKFRALVQELTGRDSILPADPSKFIMDYSDDLVGGVNQTVLDHASKIDDNHALKIPTLLDLSGKQQLPTERQDDYIDDNVSLLDSSSFDEYFMPQVYESFYQQG